MTGLEVFIGPICAIVGDIRVKENTDNRKANLQENRRKAKLENMMQLHNEALDMTSSGTAFGQIILLRGEKGFAGISKLGLRKPIAP